MVYKENPLSPHGVYKCYYLLGPDLGDLHYDNAPDSLRRQSLLFIDWGRSQISSQIIFLI